MALLAYTTPGEPTELAATAQRARAVELSWTAPEVDGGGVVGYRVESSVDGGVSWRELAADTGSADTSYRDASVGLGERRHYRVRGISRHGNAGPPSEPASATALHGILGIEVTSTPALGGDTYLAGEAVEVTVTLSTAVELLGSSLGLALGDAVVDAACVEGVDGQCRASPAAVFRHVVQVDEVDTDGIGWAADAIRGSAFVLGGVSRVDLTHAAAGPFAEHKVDGRALTVSVSDAVAVEGGALAFALELSRAVGHAVGVTWSTADGTAVSVDDYEAVTGGTVTFAQGEVTATVTVATVQDVLDEASETLEVVLEAASGGAEVDALADRATGTVADDDAAPEVVVSGVTVSEGEAAELALTLSGPSGRAVEVTWSTVDGTAVSGADYEAVSSGEVMFAAGETTHTVVVSTVDDAAREGEESFVVRAQRRPYAGEESPAAVEATVVIAADGDAMFLGGGFDAPALPTEEVWSADLTVGTVANLYGYYVNTFGALTDTEFSLDASGYSVVRLYHGGDLTLALNRTIPSEALDDLVVRLGGRHFLLSDAVYVRVATQVHHYVFSGVSPGWTVGETIPVALLAYTTPGEPTGLLATTQGTRAVDLVWTAPELDDGGIEGYRVEFSVDGGMTWQELVASTGTADTSYRDASVGPGETRHYRVRGIGGHGNPGPPSGTASATALHGILGLEVTSTPALGGDTYLAGEAVEVTVTLSGAAELIGASLGLALGDAVVDAACVEGVDGQCRASPAVVFRHVVQADEVDTDGIGWAADALGGSAFTLGDASRMDLTHAAAGPFAEHKVDGRALTVSVSDAAAAAVAAVEGGALAFALELSRAAGHAVGVTWSTADGTAVSGEDYVAVMAGTVTFAPGEVMATVTVATVQDALDEAPETLEVVLEAASGGAEVDASADRATGTVADDDAAPEVVVSGVTVSEGEAAELALTLSVPSGRAVTVTWSTVDGTAVSGADYVAVPSGEVMFAAGETTHTVVVSTVDDAVREGEESFVVRAQRRPYAGEESPAAVEATVVIAADGGSMFPEGGFDAPALPTEEVWSADLTVGTVANLYGYYVNTFGALTDTEFSLDASGYSVVRLYHGGDLTLGLNRTIPSEALDDLVVRLGGRHFLLSDAVYVPVATQVHHYVFNGVSPGWTVGETIPVALLAYTTPGEPTGLLATTQGTRAVDLVWTAPELDDGGIEGYRVEFSVDAGVSWQALVADTGTAVTSYRDASVGPGETRHYRVRGIGGHGNPGPPSGTASATTPHGIRGIEVTSTPAQGGDTYLAGEAVEVTVTLNAAAELLATSLGLALGDAVVDAACVTGADGRCRASPAVVFRHVVQADEEDADGIGWAANAIGGSAFTQIDASRVDLTHAAAGPFAEHRVDGRALTVSVSDAAAAAVAAVEGGALAFALELSRAAGHAVGVTWSTADGTAVSVEDYVAVMAGTVTFAPGEVTATVTVATVQDALDEAPETLEVVLEAASGGAEVDASADRATGTVEDDDAAPEVVVSGVTVTEGEAAELALTLSGPSGRAVEVTWSTVDGTAVSGADYDAVTSGEVMFAAGETTRTVVVSTVDDAVREGEESFVVRAQRQPYAGEESPAAVEATVVIAADGDAMFLGGGLDAPALPTEEVWSADLTVGTHTAANLYGYYVNAFGALTATEFSLDDPGYSVVRLYHGGDLTLGLNRIIPSEALDELVVRLGGRHFPLSDAVYVRVATQVHHYVFNGVSLGWTVGETIPVALLAYTTPGEPTELVATAQGARAVELSWTAPELDDGGIEGYRVESSVDGGVNWQELAADTGTRGHELPRRERGSGRDASLPGPGDRRPRQPRAALGDGVGDGASRHPRHRGDVDAGSGRGHVSGGGGGGGHGDAEHRRGADRFLAGSGARRCRLRGGGGRAVPGIADGGVPPRRAGGRGGHGRDRLGGRRHPGVGGR